jgi:HAD superfamily hydrolase (TIGR01509 family)
MAGRVRGVIIDVDGTLINSNDAHARAWVDALAEVDIHVTFADVRRLIGMGGDNLLPAIAGLQEDSKLGRHVSARRSEIFKQRHLPKLHAFPKTRELLLRMRDAGLRLSVASSAKQEELSSLLELAKVRDLIEGATSSTDAENSKPDPDIVQAALVKLGLGPAQVIMIGDTPYDIEAASKAGISTIAFRSGGRSDSDLAGALAIYDGPADLLAHFTESPLAASRA